MSASAAGHMHSSEPVPERISATGAEACIYNVLNLIPIRGDQSGQENREAVAMPPVPKKPRSVRQNAIEAVNHCAAHQVRIAARQITRFLDARMRTTGLGIEQFNLLTEIAASETDSLAAIARSACIAKSTLTRNLQVLEKAGLVEIASDAAKPRVRMVSLTEKGVLTLEKAMPAWRSASAVLSRFVDFDLPKKLAAQSRRISVRRGG